MPRTLVGPVRAVLPPVLWRCSLRARLLWGRLVLGLLTGSRPLLSFPPFKGGKRDLLLVRPGAWACGPRPCVHVAAAGWEDCAGPPAPRPVPRAHRRVRLWGGSQATALPLRPRSSGSGAEADRHRGCPRPAPCSLLPAGSPSAPLTPQPSLAIQLQETTLSKLPVVPARQWPCRLGTLFPGHCHAGFCGCCPALPTGFARLFPGCGCAGFSRLLPCSARSLSRCSFSPRPYTLLALTTQHCSSLLGDCAAHGGWAEA